MATFGGEPVPEVGGAPEPEALDRSPLPTVVSAAGSDYTPATPLEAKISEVLAAITSARETKPKFVKIQLQFPKVAKVFQTVKGVFEEIDADKSGTIEMSEMTTALGKMGAEVTAEEVGAIFAASDEDGNEKLSFQEFLVFLCLGHLLEKLPETPGFGEAFKVAVDAFDVFDVANQGVIVLSEVRATLKDAGTPETLVARMTEMDKDGNGYVIFPEFLMAFCDWVGVEDEDDDDDA